MDDIKEQLEIAAVAFQDLAQKIYNHKAYWSLVKGTTVFMLGIFMTHRLQKIVLRQ